MRLTVCLLKKFKFPRGNIWRGKYRLVKEVTPKARNDLINAYAVEEQNMFYLRHPYVTPEQSFGHTKELQKHEKWVENFRKKNLKVKENVTFEERYAHLLANSTWE